MSDEETNTEPRRGDPEAGQSTVKREYVKPKLSIVSMREARSGSSTISRVDSVSGYS